MRIYINQNYSADVDDNLLGHVGEANARTITVTQPDVQGADTYRLRFQYSDGVVYDVALIGGRMTVGGSLLREVGFIKCQWLATAQDGENYRLVAKSEVFTLRVGESISDEIAPVPSYEQAVTLMDRVLAELNKPDAPSGSAVILASGSAESVCGVAEIQEEVTE